AGSESLRELVVPVLAMAAAYGAIGTATAALTHFGGVHAPLVRAAVACTAVGAVFGGAGLGPGSGLHRPLFERAPEEGRAAVVGGAGGLLAMLALSAVAFAASLGAHASTALRLAEALHSGVVGGLVLTLVAAALVPNAVLYTGAFLAGPGFALGVGTTVAP